ncbi:DNA-binding response regulator [Gemmatimonadetes bacterium T265]|nr:DNA-binding response regulator [Gemmatimonadetes bacterium T265]
MSVSPPPVSPAATLRVLIVDDDAGARRRAREVVEETADVQIVGECADGESAIALIGAARPDVVLLDVQMPGLDGFGVVNRIGTAAMPPVIFTSAYAEFAIRAFEACAVDYVLKPFDSGRLLTAIDRVRRELAARRERAAASAAPGATAGDGLAADPRMQLLLELVANPARPRYPDALAIKAGAQYAVVRVADVDWIEADGNYARVFVQKRPRLVSKSLATLEREVLDPARFVRVHRSTVVNVSRVAAVEPGDHGDVDLLLHDGTRIVCSRRYRERLEQRLYFTT